MDALRMEEELEALSNWNKMIRHLKQAKEAWEAFGMGKVVLEEISVPSLIVRATQSPARATMFEKCLPDLVRFWRTNGGIDLLEVPSEILTEAKKSLVLAKKKEKDNARTE